MHPRELSFVTKNVILLPLTLVLLMACGGGGGGGDDEGPSDVLDQNSLEKAAPAAIGTLVDSPVSGLHFSTETGAGTTDSKGSFPFVEGETITFKLGDTSLPPVLVKRTITPLDIFATTDTNNINVVNFSRLMQSLDTDGDPSNGISIGNSAHTAATGMAIQFDSPTFDADVAALVANSGSVNTALIDQEQALTHLEISLNAIPQSGEYFEVYGATAGDYNFTTSSRELLGTSNGGMVFDVRSYERFIIYVPPTSSTVYFDAIERIADDIIPDGYDEYLTRRDSGDNEFTHRLANMDVTTLKGVNDVFGSNISDICAVDCTGWFPRNVSIEGPPDGFTIKSTPGFPSYYSFSTDGAEYIRIQLINAAIVERSEACGFSTPYLELSEIYRAYLYANTYGDFLNVINDCGEPLTTTAENMPGDWLVNTLFAGAPNLKRFTFNADGSGEWIEENDFPSSGTFTWIVENGIVRINMSINDSAEIFAVYFWAIWNGTMTTYTETTIQPEAVYNYSLANPELGHWVTDLSTFDDEDGFIWSGTYVKE